MWLHGMWLWELHLHIYLAENMHGCLPSVQNHYELQEAVREDFSMELRRKGISKYLSILLNDSHPLESGWWISGYETCCGFLQLIHMNVYFISFIHLISLCIYLHTHFFSCCQLPFLLTSPFKSKWCSNKRTNQVMHEDTHLRTLKFPHSYITAFCIQIQAEGPKISTMNIQK